MSKKSFLLVSVLVLIFSANLNAITIDGTSTVKYIYGNYVFRNQQDAQGYVALNGGFTLLGGKAILDMVGNVASGMDLRHSSTLELRGDLHLSSNTTFSFSRGNYGYINGQANTIYLGGDLDIADMSTLIITGSMVIDGQGNSLTLGHRAQLLVDGGVSLTLRNLVVKNTLNTFARPALRCMDWFSHLTLDNAEFALNDDFVFANGQMFFNNDVVYSGTSTFIYSAVRPSYITQHSCLHFDSNTTFYYDTANSATSGHVWFDVNDETNKDLIKMQDKTSSLFFDNCTLQTTHTGMRMTKGKVFFDNKVTLSSAFSKTLSGTIDTAYSTQSLAAQSAAWHPDGQHITVGTYGHERIYKWDGSSLNLIHVTEFADDGLDQSKSAAWSPNGKYLFIGNDGQTNKLYKWDTTLTPTLIHLANTAESDDTYGVDWHPSGQFIAVASGSTSGGTANRVYKWDGSSLTLIDSTTETDSSTEVKWSPDGKYLSITNDSSTANRIYSWDGATLTLVYSTNDTDSSNSQWWSSDGRHLVVGNAAAASKVYKWDGSTLRPITTLPATGQATWGVSWSHDGQFIAEANWTGGNRIYKWNGDSVTYIASTDAGSGGLGYTDSTIPLIWSIDGKYLAAINWNGPVRIYSLYYRSEAPNQAFTQSIILGNSSQGVGYDVDVYILGGARVELDGLINYDNVN